MNTAETRAPLVHRVTLAEWETKSVSDVILTDADRELAGQLRAAGRLNFDELSDAVRIQARAWVGVVRFDALELSIVPKLAGETLGLARLLAFTRDISALQRSRGLQMLEVDREPNLLELLALLFVESVEQLVKEGILPSYLEQEDDLGVLRGRLQVTRQVRRHFGRVDVLACRFDELETNTVENQILSAALHAAARRVDRTDLRRRLKYLSGLFDEVCTLESFDFQAARTSVSYDRLNSSYRDPHALAWLFLDTAGIPDLLPARGDLRSFAFLLDMNSLFEQFVFRLVQQLLPERRYSVELQERNYSVLWDPKLNRSYASIRPDVVVRDRAAPGGAIAVDAKYKLYDQVDPSSADIYQGLLYAQAYAGRESVPGNPDRTPTAVMLYPSTGAKLVQQRVRLLRPARSAAADVVVCGIPVRTTVDHLLGFARSSVVPQIRGVILDALCPESQQVVSYA